MKNFFIETKFYFLGQKGNSVYNNLNEVMKMQEEDKYIDIENNQHSFSIHGKFLLIKEYLNVEILTINLFS